MEAAVTAQLRELLSRPEHAMPLDRAVLLLSAHARPSLDVDAELARLDELASRVREPTLDGLCRLLFDDAGFRGNAADYYDPDNSFLDQVLDRRTGIPISLSVLTLEVGRRVGVPLVGVGLPGHFLVRDQVDQGLFIDPFRRGARLREPDVARLFGRIHEGARLEPAHLAPVGRHAIVGRMLANLRAIYHGRRDRRSLAWVLRARTMVPGAPTAEREALADVLTSIGRWDEAAAELEQLAGISTDPEPSRRKAARLRARLN